MHRYAADRTMVNFQSIHWLIRVASSLQDIVNAVLSSDADTFLFGGKCVIQNWSGSLTPVQRKRKAGLPAEGEEDNMPEPLNPKTPMEYVDVYQIDDIQKSVGWDRNALLFVSPKSRIPNSPAQKPNP